MFGTQTQNRITLSGSAQIVAEFFNYCINSIIYQRGLYPPEYFTRVKKYELSMVMASEETLSNYLTTLNAQVQKWLENNDLHSMAVVIYGIDSQTIFERWHFDVHTDPESIDSNGTIEREKDILIIQKEIRTIFQQIVSSITFLPLLSEPCAFEVLAYTSKNTAVPLKWEFSDAHQIADSETVKLSSFSTNIHNVDSSVSFKRTF